ncbi:MAG: isoprenyl transferase [Candidatus Omnitrophica bacterium]|nr:isoprenyl transferase [Candidatus Omnitrophota bacterium]
MENNLPKHIAIIMDGNGRWAKHRGLPRTMGHRAGIKSVRRVVEACVAMKIPVLTLYAFSVENWKRPKKEIGLLMRLLSEFLEKEIDEMNEHNIRFMAIGRLEELPDFVRERLWKTIQATSQNTGLVLNLALNYGGRSEIIDATKKIVQNVKEAKMSVDAINEESFSKFLYTDGIPDPDLLIRTSGEMRISNFLLWQISYSEIVVTKKLWPDFDRSDLEKAIQEFQSRERRFGATEAISRK